LEAAVEHVPWGGILAVNEGKSFWRAFLDFFVLFSGVSTASNLSRTRNSPVVGRGMFLFRKRQAAGDSGAPAGQKP
jgi:hypothetical protein